MVTQRTALTILVVIAATGFARAATLPKGTYAVSSYYVSTTPVTGGSCAFGAGALLASEYDYPGPSKPGATSRTFVNASGVQYVLVTTYPTTPASGATTWSGNLTSTFLPGGPSQSGTFTATFTVVDDHSYVAKFTATYPTSCTYVIQEIGILSGK